MTSTDTDAEAAAFYDEHGWYVPEATLDTDLIDAARATVEQIHDPLARDAEIPAKLRDFLAWEPGQPRPTRLNQYIVLQYQSIARLALAPLVGEIAAQLMATDEVRVFNTSLVRKQPGDAQQYARVGWHADMAYWPTCSSERLVTAWIPLQDTTPETGTLTVLDGSHAWLDGAEVARIRRARTFITQDHEQLERQLAELGRELVVRPLELRRGQLSFHHPHTLHGSGVNRGTAPRIAISVHLQAGENGYRAAVDARGEPLTYVHDDFVARLASGEPDYADPDICPVIWRGA